MKLQKMTENMRNKTKYSLKDVALRIDRSVPWINKMQKLTGLPRKTGKRGVKVEFSQADFNMLRIFKVLRALDVDVKKLDRINKKELYRKYNIMYSDMVWFEHYLNNKLDT